MNVKQQYKDTLESMMVALENSPFDEIEQDMSKSAELKTSEHSKKLLDIVGGENFGEASDLIGYIEYWNKVEAYKCGFRRAIHIMLDTFFGGESNE